MGQGISIVVSRIERFVPDLAALCAGIRARMHEQIHVNAVVTTGSGGAFPVHYDPEDLLIFQMEGSKRWQLLGTPLRHPVTVEQAEPTVPGTPYFDAVLNAGDILLVPSGSWHHCENGPGLSLHLAVSFEPPSAWKAMQSLVEQLPADEAFRAPLTRFAPEALDEYERTIKDRLHRRIDALSLRDFIAAKQPD